MPRKLYNEGRVVGYSAYEVYVRHAISEGMEPVSEKEWLSATLTDGSSLLLQLTPNQLDKNGNTLNSVGTHIIDIPLPETNKYELTTSEPEDWKTRWYRYYVQTGIEQYARLTVMPVPTWLQNTYYQGTPPTWESNKYYRLDNGQYELTTSTPIDWFTRWMFYYESTDGEIFKPAVGASYTLTESQPANWITTWDTYFVRKGEDPNYTYVLATNWKPNMYYRRVETHITAANTIVASFFMGDGYYENTDDFWAKHVKSYGPLLKNTTPYSSETYMNAEYVETSAAFPSQWNAGLQSYANIVDGDVIVSGDWLPNLFAPEWETPNTKYYEYYYNETTSSYEYRLLSSKPADWETDWRKYYITNDGGTTYVEVPDATTQPPNDFKPDLSDTASPTILRLYLKAPLLTRVNILLTGFMLKSILKGMTNLTDGSINTNYPEDGDFLGPSTFPWGNKIIFSIPPACIEALLSAYTRTLRRYHAITSQSPPDNWSTNYYNYYKRCKDTYSETVVEPNNWSTIYKDFYTKSGGAYIPITSSTAPTWQANTYYAGPYNGFISLNGIVNSAPEWSSGEYYIGVGGSASPQAVDNVPVIDVSNVPQQYYESNYVNSPIDFTINGKNAAGNNVLTVYSRYDILPPALYSSRIESTGNAALYPVDTVAPGTVKIFEGVNKENEASTTNYIDGNIGMYRDENHIIHQNPNANVGESTVPIAEATVNDIDIPGETSRIAYSLDIETGDKLGKAVSLRSSTGPGSDLDLDGTNAVMNPSASIDYPSEQNVPDSYCGTLHWNDLLHALATNKSIDLFNNDYFLTRFAEVLANKLIAGGGIGIDKYHEGQSDSTATIRLKLSPRRTAGSNPNTAGGITISETSLSSDTQRYIKVNTGKSTQIVNDAIEVKFNPTQGAGIKVTQDSNGVKITNTLPSYENSNWSSTSFTASTNFGSGGFCALDSSGSTGPTFENSIIIKYNKSDDNSVIAVDIEFGKDGNTVGHAGFGEKWMIRDSDEAIIPNYVPADIGNGYHLFSSKFAFIHDYSTTLARSHAVILGIKLDAPLRTLLRNQGYTFKDTSDNFSGIWNVKVDPNATDNRASWPARCELRANSGDGAYSGATWPKDVISDSSQQDWDLIVVGLSYADGYNTQLTRYNYNSGASGATDVLAYSNHINLHVSGMFKKVIEP